MLRKVLTQTPAIAVCLMVASCASAPKPMPSGATEAGCSPPPASVFTAAGVDLKFAQSTFGKVVVGEVSAKTDPRVISLASQAATDDQIRLYVRCIAIRRDRFTPAQVAYFETMNAFLQTKPSSDQFIAWQKNNVFPGVAKIPEDDAPRTSAADRPANGVSSPRNVAPAWPAAPTLPASVPTCEQRSSDSFGGGMRNVTYSSAAVTERIEDIVFSIASVDLMTGQSARVSVRVENLGVTGTAMAFRAPASRSIPQARINLADGSGNHFVVQRTSELPFGTTSADWAIIAPCSSRSIVIEFLSRTGTSGMVSYSLTADIWLAVRDGQGDVRAQAHSLFLKR